MTELENLIREIQYASNPKLNLEEIAVSIGYTRPYLSSIKKKADNETVIALLKAKYSDILQNVTFPEKVVDKDQSQVIQQQVELIGVPVYDVEFSAGFVEQIRDKQPEILTYINMPDVQGCDYVIRAKGDSMADYINNMDWIGIKRIEDKEVIAYGNPYAIVTKDLQLIKYIRKGPKGTYLLTSKNKDYDDFELPIAKVLDLFIIKTVLKIKTII